MGNDDFVRVPREPTDDMLNAAQERLCELQSATNFNDLDQAEMYKAMLSAAPPSAPSGEPVAWKWKWVDTQTWMLSESEPDDDGLREIKPLYAAPSGDNVSTPSRLVDRSAAAAGKSREGELRIIGHRIGDDGWPDEIWEGVNRCEITLHLDTGPLKDVRGHVIVKTIDGDKRGEVGDWIVTSGDGSFDVWKADIFNPLCSRLQPAAASEADNVSTPQSTGLSAIAQERDVDGLVEDIDEAADELIDSVQYLQETMAAGEGVYESKWLGGVMRAHEMLLQLSEHIKHADAWPCDGEGDEHGNFVCKKDRVVGKPVAYRIDLGHGFNYYDAAPGKYEKLQAQGRPIQALYLTTSPKAISEAPISAEAVNQSPDVAEMVERLNRSVDEIEIEMQDAHDAGDRPDLWDQVVELPIKDVRSAASLLQSLARERERLREHLRQLVLLAEDSGRKNWAIVISARSALPHPDTKGT